MSKIVIIGVGQLGSHVLLAGRNWEGTLKVVDFDKVEQKNTQAQFHTRMGLGRNKTVALQQAMQGMFGLKLETVPHKLTDGNAKELLGGATLVLDCTDNAEARRVIQRFVRANKVPCLHGALDANGTFGRIVWDEHFKEDEEGTPGQATCEAGETLPFGMLVAAQMAVTAQRFLQHGEKRSYMVNPTGAVRLA